MFTEDHVEPVAAGDEDDGQEWPPANAANLRPSWFRLDADGDSLAVLTDRAGGELFIWRRRVYEDAAFRRFDHVTVERTDRIVDGEVELGHARIVVDTSARDPHEARWLVHAVEDAAAILWQPSVRATA